ncbi:hypothetical protein QQ020_33165 [Fulvivirgaceae bacterium BMA12]|uniref:NIPSNAP family containing protein n=1 Tax=Agaribacillus aureus TaxID=3051825 RepID=A0ABT8LGP3_9BACT|nr:hypothetical protein [Fulvivirgaceae bacterium BMA12]
MNKNMLLMFCILSLSVLISSPLLHAQDQPQSTIYVEVDYMKARPGGDYMSLEKDIWKALHQERIKNGDIVGWYLYGVKFPYGQNTDYDYVTVTVYNDIAKLEDPYKQIEAMAKKAYPDMDIAELSKKTAAARDLVWGEVFTVTDEAIPGPSASPAQFIAVNFMEVEQGKGAAYEEMERELVKPVHAARAEAGDMQDWLLLSRMAPWGDEYEYQYMTVDLYGSWENMSKDSFGEAWKKVHPEKDMATFYEKILETRTLKRQETWQLLDYITEGDIAASE